MIMVTKKPLCLPSAAGELGDCEYKSWSSNPWKGKVVRYQRNPKPESKGPSPNQEHHPKPRASASGEKIDVLAQEEQGDAPYWALLQSGN